MKPLLATLLLLSLGLTGCIIESGHGYGERGWGDRYHGDRDHWGRDRGHERHRD